MRIISRKPLTEFAARHPQAKGPLDAWYAECRRAKWSNFADVRAMYRSADVLVGNRAVFDISGNKYRLVVKIAYKVGNVYIRFVGTHAEYDKIDAEKV